jgi:hypothetical protein
MSSHHDHNDHHSNEPKPVAFRTPMILGLVTMLVIVLLVSTCDKKHGCCEDGEKCEASCEAKHGGHEEHHEAAATEHSNVEGHEHDVLTEEAAAVADSIMHVDSTEAHPAEAAHH